MKIKFALLTMLALVAFVASGCGLASTLMGGSKGGTVSTLWSDVPPLPNASKADIQIPPLANILITGFVAAANNDSSNDTKLDKFDFIAYQTADTPQQVSDFYTTEKMTAAGWNQTDTPGCQVGATEGANGGFCVFGKKGDAGKATVLMILPIQDDTTKQTQVFFLRFDATQKTK